MWLVWEPTLYLTHCSPTLLDSIADAPIDPNNTELFNFMGHDHRVHLSGQHACS